MPATVNWTLNQLAAHMDHAAADLTRLDLTPAMKACALMANQAARDCFDGSHGPDGSPWPKLKVSPRATKRGGDLPLRDRGFLMASITSGAAVEITPQSMTVGTNLEYAAVHQWGATISFPEKKRDKPWVFKGRDGRTVFTRKIKAHTVTIPARPFLGWNQQLIEDCAAEISEYAGRLFAGGII